jgi:hypothetical protein
VPFVLRSYDSGNRFRLLGEAYVHGFMEGQVKDFAEKADMRSDTLALF